MVAMYMLVTDGVTSIVLTYIFMPAQLAGITDQRPWANSAIEDTSLLHTVCQFDSTYANLHTSCGYGCNFHFQHEANSRQTL